MIKIKKPTHMTSTLPKVHCQDYLPIIEGAVMMLYSGGGVGKSFAAIREAVEFAITTGKKSILWLTEDPEGENRDRYERLIKEQARPRDYFDQRIDFVTDSPVKFTKLRDSNPELTDEFWQIRLQLYEYDFIVLDPLLQFHGGEENSNTHAGVLMAGLKDWASEEDKSILLLHHATSVDKGTRLKPRGAGEFVNGTRGCYEIRMFQNEQGQMIEEKKDQRNFILIKDNGLSYHFRDKQTGLLERELKVFPPYNNRQEVTRQQGSVRMSLASHNNEKNPKGFLPIEVPFDSIHKTVTGGCCYSPYLFADGHRKNENNLGYSDFLCLDFDDGMTLQEAEQKFFKYRALIVTTRSHQQEGKGDRFRVFLNLKTPLAIPAYDFPDFMKTLFKLIGNVDEATKDLGRFFFASPDDAYYKYSDSHKNFDWEPIYQAVKKEKVLDKINKQRKMAKPEKQREYSGDNAANTLPSDTMFITHSGGSSSFSSFRDSLSYGEKVPVQCRNGHGHNGGQGPDKNAAAFIKKHDNGNVFYHCSGAKCASDGSLFCED